MVFRLWLLPPPSRGKSGFTTNEESYSNGRLLVGKPFDSISRGPDRGDSRIGGKRKLGI